MIAEMPPKPPKSSSNSKVTESKKSPVVDPLGEVGHDLVTIEVEIDPVRAGASLRAAKQATIEAAGFFEVTDGKGEMKAGQGHVYFIAP